MMIEAGFQINHCPRKALACRECFRNGLCILEVDFQFKGFIGEISFDRVVFVVG